MELGLREKRVLVTGASSNIGRAIAVAFGEEGATVAIGYHRDEAGAAHTATLVEQAGGRPLVIGLDLGDEARLRHGADRALTELGGIDVLVNNAVAFPGPPAPDEMFETAPADRMRRSLATNLLGHYLLSQAAVASMRANGWGRIVHVSTGLVEDGRSGAAAYVTPKSGLHGLTRTMSRELASAGILTNLVMAGFVVGDRRLPDDLLRQAAAAAATGRTTEAVEVANLVVFLCSSANGHVTGELIRADGHFLTPA
ncbi:SDR family NAD(P)-dependent oxidoreductase [Plantactinospora sonchi]|uniref:SDR family oxidoreductase n=1 Tax=Plantactinospora sonchi TaxID=1544735 RepID=A0ABU7RYZ4_9ACTN